MKVFVLLFLAILGISLGFKLLSVSPVLSQQSTKNVTDVPDPLSTEGQLQNAYSEWKPFEYNGTYLHFRFLYSPDFYIDQGVQCINIVDQKNSNSRFELCPLSGVPFPQKPSEYGDTKVISRVQQMEHGIPVLKERLAPRHQNQSIYNITFDTSSFDKSNQLSSLVLYTRQLQPEKSVSSPNVTNDELIHLADMIASSLVFTK